MKLEKDNVNQAFENIITYDVIVDCYNETEQAMGWYYYLQDHLLFPFEACIIDDPDLPFSGAKVTVIALASEEACSNGIYIIAKNKSDCKMILQLEHIRSDELEKDTPNPISLWKYWIAQSN
ncbi:MAG: calcium-binding protein [Verrucomicrobiota bacterium]